MRVFATPIAAALLSTCGTPQPDPDIAVRQKAFDEIAMRCGLPKESFIVISVDATEFYPPYEGGKVVDCALNEIRKLPFNPHLGFSGNEVQN